MDKVLIRGLKVNATVGIHDWEQQISRPLIFDVTLETDIRAAAASDEVADAVDYAAVSQRIMDVVQASRPKLLETLLEKICASLLEAFNVQSVRIKVDKPGAVPGAAGVGVEIERYKK